MLSREARWAQKRQQFLSVGSNQPPVQLPPPLGNFSVDFASVERSINSDLRSAAAAASFMAAPVPPPGPAQVGGGIWRPPQSQLPPPHPSKDALDFALSGAMSAPGGEYSGVLGRNGRTMTREEAWAAKRGQGRGDQFQTFSGGGGITGGNLGMTAARTSTSFSQQWAPPDSVSRSSSRGSTSGTLSGVGMSQVLGYGPQQQQQQQQLLQQQQYPRSYPPPQQQQHQYHHQQHQYQQQQPQQQQHYSSRQGAGGGRSSVFFG